MWLLCIAVRVRVGDRQLSGSDIKNKNLLINQIFPPQASSLSPQAGLLFVTCVPLSQIYAISSRGIIDRQEVLKLLETLTKGEEWVMTGLFSKADVASLLSYFSSLFPTTDHLLQVSVERIPSILFIGTLKAVTSNCKK